MNEAQLELSVMELFQQEGYEYLSGDSILRETTDVLLKDDLRMYLMMKYAADGITSNEIETIIFGLVRASHEPLYDANKEMLNKIIEGFVLRREDKTKKDLKSTKNFKVQTRSFFCALVGGGRQKLLNNFNYLKRILKIIVKIANLCYNYKDKNENEYGG